MNQVMGRVLTLAVTLVSLFVFSASAQASGNINVFLGSKTLNEDDWEPLEFQGEGGFLIDFKQDAWPVSIAIDSFVSYAEETGTITVPGVGTINEKLEGTTSEFDIGVRKYWGDFPRMRPYLGGGLAFVTARIEAQTGQYTYVRDDDDGVGLWINGGVFWTLEKFFNVGVDARYTAAEVDLFGDDIDAGGFHLGLLLGYHWGN